MKLFLKIILFPAAWFCYGVVWLSFDLWKFIWWYDDLCKEN